MTSLGRIGREQPLIIRQGGTVGPYRMTLRRRATATPIDLTGSSFEAVVLTTAKPSVVVATLVVNVDDPVNGAVSWTLDAADAASIDAGVRLTDPASVYRWRLDWTRSDGVVVPLLYGPAVVARA